jgi:phosphonatase-like hydrolase
MIKLMVLDMAGTTVRDKNEVEDCFLRAAKQSNLKTTPQRVNDLQGISKLTVINTLWDEFIGKNHPDFEVNVQKTFALFQEILENHYLTQPVFPAFKAEETLHWLREKEIKIALTTGFYRKVTNIILNRLGWDKHLDAQYFNASGKALIDLSLTPDETNGVGRPEAAMIFKAMSYFGITDPKEVANIGDTPSDILSGNAANVLFSLGVLNGTHTKESLEEYSNHGLLNSLAQLPEFLENQSIA